MENEDDVVVVGAELLEVFLELGEIVIALLEDLTRLPVETKLWQPDKGHCTENAYQDGETSPVIQQQASVALRKREAVLLFRVA